MRQDKVKIIQVLKLMAFCKKALRAHVMEFRITSIPFQVSVALLWCYRRWWDVISVPQPLPQDS